MPRLKACPLASKIVGYGRIDSSATSKELQRSDPSSWHICTPDRLLGCVIHRQQHAVDHGVHCSIASLSIAGFLVHIFLISVEGLAEQMRGLFVSTNELTYRITASMGITEYRKDEDIHTAM